MKILILDSETTGLPEKNISLLATAQWPYIVQLSYILFDTDTNKMIQLSDNIIKLENNIDIPIEASNIHHITKDISLKLGNSIKNILLELNNILLETDLIIGHNLIFDINMLKVEFLKNNLSNNFIINNISIPLFCTMKNGRNICNIKKKSRNGSFYIKNPKLIELYNYFFNDTPKNLHNSLNDILITLRCYYKMEFNLDIINELNDIKNLMNNNLFK